MLDQEGDGTIFQQRVEIVVVSAIKIETSFDKFYLGRQSRPTFRGKAMSQQCHAVARVGLTNGSGQGQD